MLKLNTDEIKNLQFEVSIQGINYDELEGSLKFVIEDIEYGIPVKIQKDLVSVEVPPLEEIVAKGMKHGDVVECKLDIFGNGFYINPWGGQFELETPIRVETKNLNMYKEVKKDKKVVAELKNKTPSIEAEIVEEEEVIEEQPKGYDHELILEMLFEKLAEKGFKVPDQDEPIVEQKKVIPKKRPVRKPAPKPVKKQLTREQLVEQKIKGKFSKVNNLVKNIKHLTEGKKVIRKPKVKTPKSVPKKYETNLTETYDAIQNIRNRKKEQIIKSDDHDPVALMESLGMKNPRMQSIMMEKAIELGGDGDKAICNTLKKLLGAEKIDPYEQYKMNNNKP